jgi:mannose-6-phosphate isomerase-like protein (cupin superfamily)
MRGVIVSSLLLLGCVSVAHTAEPRQTQPQRAGMAITVTDPRGATLAGVHVEILGASDRSSDTNESGQVNFPGLQAGTYRLRFSGDQVIAFERDITIRAGKVADVDITLNSAPPPPPPAPEPPPPAAVGPAGQPQLLSIVDLVERQLIGGDAPRRETMVACSGNTRTRVIQLNQDQPQRLYEGAEITYYVVAGEGAVRLNERDTAVAAGSLVALPRGTPHALVRRGRRPLILLVTLSGEPCAEAR